MSCIGLYSTVYYAAATSLAGTSVRPIPCAYGASNYGVAQVRPVPGPGVVPSNPPIVFSVCGLATGWSRRRVHVCVRRAHSRGGVYRAAVRVSGQLDRGGTPTTSHHLPAAMLQWREPEYRLHIVYELRLPCVGRVDMRDMQRDAAVCPRHSRQHHLPVHLRSRVAGHLLRSVVLQYNHQLELATGVEPELSYDAVT
jgi:hypothetical protein